MRRHLLRRVRLDVHLSANRYRHDPDFVSHHLHGQRSREWLSEGIGMIEGLASSQEQHYQEAYEAG